MSESKLPGRNFNPNFSLAAQRDWLFATQFHQFPHTGFYVLVLRRHYCVLSREICITPKLWINHFRIFPRRVRFSSKAICVREAAKEEQQERERERLRKTARVWIKHRSWVAVDEARVRRARKYCEPIACLPDWEICLENVKPS